MAEDPGHLVPDQHQSGQVVQVPRGAVNRSPAELGVLVPVLGVAVMGVVGPPVVLVGIEDEEAADEGDRLVEPAGPEGGEVVALVLGGVEIVDEQALEREERHAPPRPPCVVHRHRVERDRPPVAGEVEEGRCVAAFRELGQPLLRNDPLDADEVLHATFPLPIPAAERITGTMALRSGQRRLGVRPICEIPRFRPGRSWDRRHLALVGEGGTPSVPGLPQIGRVPPLRLRFAEESQIRYPRPHAGEVAEWPKAAVLKTVDPQGSGGESLRHPIHVTDCSP